MKSRERITVDEQDIGEVDTFSYLGAIICTGGGVKDMKNRLCKAKGAFVKRKRICNSKSIRKITKLRLFNLLVAPPLVLRM